MRESRKLANVSRGASSLASLLTWLLLVNKLKSCPANIQALLSIMLALHSFVVMSDCQQMSEKVA